VVGEGPTQRRRHPVGMIGAERVTFTRTDRGYEIVQPHGPVVVTEGHDGGAGTAAASAGLNHGLNLDAEASQNKDLPHHPSPALLKVDPTRRELTRPSKMPTAIPCSSITTTAGTLSMPADRNCWASPW